MRRMLSATLLLGLAASSAHARAEQPSELMLTPASRKSLAITIYTNGLGLVRESREAPLKKSTNATVRFEQVSPAIIAPSVSLTVAPGADAVRVIEQAYRYDVLSPQTLTRQATGSTISLLRTHPGSGDLVRTQGEVLASFDWQPVLRTPDGITFYSNYSGIAFDKLPARWSSQPSLSWLVDVRTAGPAMFNVSYLTRNMSWTSDYVLTLARNPADAANLTGWITLSNQSGMGFPECRIAVVAGQVHEVEPPMEAEEISLKTLPRGGLTRTAYAATRSTLGEYHLYDLPEKTELPDRSSKQVQFLSTSSLHTRWRYIAETWGRYGDNVRRGSTWTDAAQAELQFDVKESEGLGVPMPQGTVRVMSPDSQGRAQLIGQANIQHTPRDETVKLRLGPAPEISLTRILLDRTSTLGWRDERVGYRLRNAKNVEVLVEVREHAPPLQSTTLPATHPDAATSTFIVKVPAGGEVRWEALYREMK